MPKGACTKDGWDCCALSGEGENLVVRVEGELKPVFAIDAGTQVEALESVDENGNENWIPATIFETPF